MNFLDYNATEEEKRKYLDASIKEPEVPMLIIRGCKIKCVS